MVSILGTQALSTDNAPTKKTGRSPCGGWRGTFAFNFLINEADQAYGAVQLQAHRKARRLSIWTGWYDRGVSQALKQCHPDVRFKPGRNVVRVSVPRNCFPWKPKGTQFIVESSGWKHDRFRFDDIDGSASYN